MGSSWCAVMLILIIISFWVILSLIPRLKHKDKIFILLSFIALWIFLSIREPYSDMVAYDTFFHSIDISHFDAIFNNRWEILFKVLLFLIRLMTSDTHIMMAIVAFITLLGPFLFVKRYSKNYLLSVVMFIAIGSFYMEFFVLRQAIAISIFLIVVHFISERKLFRYCIGIAIATMFHKTALMLILLYPLANIPRSKYKNIAIAVASVVFLIFSSQISAVLMSDFYSQYTDDAVFGEGIKLFIMYVVMYTVYYLFTKRSKSKTDDAVVKSSWLTIFLQFFAIQNNCFCRLANYTRDSFCIMIPNSVQDLKGKDRLLFSIVIIVLCICFVLVTNAFEGFNIV